MNNSELIRFPNKGFFLDKSAKPQSTDFENYTYYQFQIFHRKT